MYPKTWCWARNTSAKIFTCSQFHEVLEKVKLVYCDGNVNSGCLLGVGGLNGNGLRDLSW